LKSKAPQRGNDAAKAPQKSAAASKKPAPLEGVSTEAVPQDSTYLGTIAEAAGKYGVDPKLVSAVAEVESGFSQDAVSATGAVGVMQLMPETAESLGVNPYDAAQNIDGGAHYLKKMLDTFDGDLRKAVAAYNAGPEAVREYGGVPPYSETQQYVSSVLDIYK
ncbi:MAG: lytic transglycosylase domain-containing protein, partial [Schwartzia sp.]|nr:lytic transglycosylase domain-containing protein [Schwartzia sp. (in: firmicutes)]